MDSNSGRDLTSRWSDLPPDVLLSIADLLDPTIGILRLRSVCRSWLSSLSLSTSSLHFPLILPFPVTSSTSHSLPPAPPPSHLSLLQRTVYFLSSPGDPSNGFLIKVEKIGNSCPNTFSILDPLCCCFLFCEPDFVLNLLDYSISLVCKSYAFEPVDVEVPIRKVVVSTNFFTNSDFVVLGLSYSGSLLLWRLGEENWTEIVSNGRLFDDVISYRGKFYATADGKGRLVLIDSRLQPIYVVHSLMYGCGKCTNLVESDGDLYLVDRFWINQGLGSGFGVFKLDEKGRFWDYELNLNGCLFFIGSDANFAISNKDYDGCIRDCIYFIVQHEEPCKHHAVFDVKKSTITLLVDSKPFAQFYWPPWCNEAMED